MQIKLVNIYRLSMGVLIFVAIASQVVFGNYPDTTSIVHFFSYFTVLSNLLMAGLLVTLGLDRCDPKELDGVRGATALYLLMTGLGFVFLLNGSNQELLGWVNIVLHYVAPVVMMLDWLLIRSSRITFYRGLRWLIFPTLYLIYTYGRGSLLNWYPYTFLNPQVIGWKGVAAYLIGLIITHLFFIYDFTKYTHKTKS